MQHDCQAFPLKERVSLLYSINCQTVCYASNYTWPVKSQQYRYVSGFSSTYDRNLHSARPKRWYKSPLLKYSIYAWGCPAVIVFITLLATQISFLPNSKLIPDIVTATGSKTCWFGSKYLEKFSNIRYSIKFINAISCIDCHL